MSKSDQHYMNHLTSHWDYRVMITVTPRVHMDDAITYGIHEVYYRGSKVISWTDTPIEIVEESLKDLKKTLKNMLEACKLPVLDSITGEEIK
jgi:hypothetical protein